jgi:5-methyltetrahydrofolate corrinoid/iron sulfur protein methyltransferase
VIIIGEKINGSLPGIRAAIQNRDAREILDLAKRQAEAGASFVDVNVGTGMGSRQQEVESMRWAVETIQDKTAAPLSIDSSDPAVLEAGLKARNGGSSLINSALGGPGNG